MAHTWHHEEGQLFSYNGAVSQDIHQKLCHKWVLKVDNNEPKHTSKVVARCMDMRYVCWRSSESPDLNLVQKNCVGGK